MRTSVLGGQVPHDTEAVLGLFFRRSPTKQDLAGLYPSGVVPTVLLFPHEDHYAVRLALHSLGVEPVEVERLDFFYHGNEALKNFVRIRTQSALSLENWQFLSHFDYIRLERPNVGPFASVNDLSSSGSHRHSAQ